MKRLLLLIYSFIFLNGFYSVGQTPEADTLKILIQKANEDTSKVDLLLALGKIFFSSDPNALIQYGTSAKELSEKINYQKGLAYAYKNIGRGYFIKGSYVEALQNYTLSLAVFDSINDKVGVANMKSQIGGVYFDRGDESKALELFLQSLKLSEELNDTLRTLTALGNIGAVYSNKKQTYNEALQFFLRALPLSVAIGDNGSIGTNAVNIGEVYFKKYEMTGAENKLMNGSVLIDSALVYFQQSLKAYEGTVDASYTLNFLGKAYREKKDYTRAINYQQQAVMVAKKFDAQNDVSIALVGLAQTFQEKGEIQKALAIYKEAEAIANSTQSQYTLKDIYEGLSGVYASLKDYGNAFHYSTRLIIIKDIIYNQETDKKLGTLQFTFDLNKKESQITLLTKDQEIKEKEINRQKLVRNGFMGGFAVVLLFAGVFFTQRNRISKEKKRSDELLLNILPEETAEELKATGTAKAKSFDLVTVMFTDFKNFTQASERLSAEQLVKEINYCYSEFDKIITRHGIEKIKTIGDAYMCAGGLPVANNTHPVDLVKAGLEMQQFIARNMKDRIAIDQPYFELRLGIHTGPVVAGIVGIKKFAYDIWGDTVNTASRMESSGEVGKVNISGVTYELVKDHFECKHRGKIQAKNKGEIDMYFVEGIKNQK